MNPPNKYTLSVDTFDLPHLDRFYTVVFVLTFGLGFFFETNCGLMIHIDQVASDIKIILKPSQANLVVKLDMQLIEALHMGISADTVQLSILSHPKIKLKSEV